MTNYDQFSQRCKMRHDFGDQIQVRYQHSDGTHYDTWVSGTEALQRLESIAAEDQLRSLSRLDADDLRIIVDSLPDTIRKTVRRSLRDRLADRLESAIGGNPIGDAMSEAARGQSPAAGSSTSEADRWHALLRYEPFRQRVLELAWIALEGSFPDDETKTEPDDWV